MFGFGKDKFLWKICSKIMEQFEDGVVVINKNHNIVFFNDGACHVFGYTKDEVMGQHLNILVPERARLQHDVMINEFGASPHKYKSMHQRARQITGRRKDGSEFISNTSIFKMQIKSDIYYAAVVRDISENKKSEEELLKLAATDPLTGAFNRREFIALADRESVRSQRYKRPLSILMLDIDHFKKLNDSYGHAAGDKALQRFTSLCCNALRNVDIFGRWGGEEFVALLPETELAGAIVIAERLCKIVNDSVMPYNDQKIRMSVSIGVAQYKDGETSVEAPLARADKAVYDAKKSGRNRVSICAS